jgi:hypothetical protein
MKTKLLILLIILLNGCTTEDNCEEWFIYDFEYETLDDGSVIVGRPIYRCRK